MEQHDSVRCRNAQKRPVLQLEDCLRLFTEAEELSEQDPWYCPQCCRHKQATKKFDLWSLPQYLIIHLKRFSYNRYWRDKIDALVEFPTQSVLPCSSWVGWGGVGGQMHEKNSGGFVCKSSGQSLTPGCDRVKDRFFHFFQHLHLCTAHSEIVARVKRGFNAEVVHNTSKGIIKMMIVPVLLESYSLSE